MKKTLIVLSALALLITAGCQAAETANQPSTENAEDVTTVYDQEYLSENFGFNINIPEGYAIYTANYDNAGIEKSDTVWVGPDSDYWSEGFYIRSVEDLEARITEIKEGAVEVIEEKDEIAIGNINAHKITVGSEIGYNVTYYFVWTSSKTYEIQVLDTNEEAQTAITESFFIPATGNY